jgi:hypothetical protein
MIGLGALAVKRPDGKFLIVTANPAATSTTNIYDPVANTFIAGPALASITGTTGAGEGAAAVALPNGRILIVHGGATSLSSIYDPVNNSMTVGPQPHVTNDATVTTVGAGSMFIPRLNGTYLFIPGMVNTQVPGSLTGATNGCSAIRTTTNIFNPYTMSFTVVGAPAMQNGTGPGAFAFQRRDGQWVIIKGGATAVSCVPLATTVIYDPIGNQFFTGPTLTGAVNGPGPGGHAIPRPDGSWLVVFGNAIMATSSIPRTGETGILGTTTTNIYISSSTSPTRDPGQFVVGPAYVSNVASGATSFQRADGKFVTISGAATSTVSTAVQVYDAGWVPNGIYRSEQFDLSPVGTKLTSETTLVWKSNMNSTALGGISAEIRTARTQAELGTSTLREITNGGLVNPGTTDTWAQIYFNFRRTFPSYGGIYTDVWGSNSMAYPLRNIITPILYEYKLTKDKDVLNLQADGLSIFRVSSSGDVFTQAGGTINTSGADLAERYTSQEELEFGDVVTIDPFNNHAVKKSQYQYQTDMVGVVSTDPGFISGAYTENSYPIGLIGRVPVKVTTENGMIQAGDYLTTSSVPGYAMKATLSGRVLGKALESIDPSKLEACPESDMYVPGRKCTKIMMFVNLIDYGGQNVDTAMSDWKILKEAKLAKEAFDAGLSYAPSLERLATSSPVASISAHDAEVLEFLTILKSERATGVTSSSEILSDKISAISRIISPEIIAKIVKSEKFDGLEMNADRISTKTLTTDTISNAGGLTMSLVDGKLVIKGKKSRSVSPVATSSVEVASSTSNLASAILSTDISSSTTEVASSTLDLASSTIEVASTTQIANIEESDEEEITVSFDTSGNAYFAGEVVANKVSTGALSVSGAVTFSGGLEVNSIGNASTTIAMLSDVEFFGRPYFTSDTGGTAVIKKGATTVDIVFDREYIDAPIISASMTYATTSTEAEIQEAFDKDIRFVVTKRDTKGFTIRINKNVNEDVVFNWIALAVKNSKEFTSRVPDASPVVPENTISTSTPTTINIDQNQSTTTPAVINETSTSTPEIIDQTSTSSPQTNIDTVLEPVNLNSDNSELNTPTPPQLGNTPEQQTDVLPSTEAASPDNATQ